MINIRRKGDVADALDRGKEIGTGTKRMRRSPKLPRATTSACSSSCSPKNRCSPAPIFRPGRTRHSHSLGSLETCRVRRTSILPRRKSRVAGFVALERLGLHAASPAIQARGKDARIVEYDQVVRSQQVRESPGIVHRASASAPRFRCSSRDAARSDRGSCAMSSSGNE